MSITVEKKADIVAEFGKNKRDTGTTEVQVALLTEQIKGLTEHMKAHRKDFRTQRSLVIMVSKRQRLMRYLKRVSPERYVAVRDKLGLRK